MKSSMQYYKMYKCMKLHFGDGDHNYFEIYNSYKISYTNCDDQYCSHKFLRKYQPGEFQDFLIANLIHKPNIRARELLSDASHEIYIKWLRRKQSLKYMFVSELLDITENRTKNDFEMLFSSDTKSLPEIMLLTINKKISIETLIILEICITFLNIWEKNIQNDVFPEFLDKCLKYQPFLINSINKKEYQKIIQELIFS